MPGGYPPASSMAIENDSYNDCKAFSASFFAESASCALLFDVSQATRFSAHCRARFSLLVYCSMFETALHVCAHAFAISLIFTALRKIQIATNRQKKLPLQNIKHTSLLRAQSAHSYIAKLEKRMPPLFAEQTTAISHNCQTSTEM